LRSYLPRPRSIRKGSKIKVLYPLEPLITIRFLR